MESIKKPTVRDPLSTLSNLYDPSLKSTSDSLKLHSQNTQLVPSELLYHKEITQTEGKGLSADSEIQTTPCAVELASPGTFQQCKICLTTLMEGFFQLASCGHVFHEECVRMHVLVSMEEAHFPLLCPQKGCLSQISITDLQSVLSPTQLEKFYHFSFKYYVSSTNEKIFGCPTPGCENYVFRGKWDFDRHFCCGSCLKEWCADCMLPWHLFMTCQEAKIETSYGKEDKEFEDISKLKGFKRCPKCRTMVHLYTGCDFMECRCGHKFCFTCLKSHKEHTHQEYLMAERKRMREAQLKELLKKGSKTDMDIKVVDQHTQWIFQERLKNEMKLKDLQVQKAKPVPKYPPPPAGYLKSLQKIREKKQLLSRAQSRHLLPTRSAGVKITP